MRKKLSIFLASIFSFFTVSMASGCAEFSETLDFAFENECLIQENELLEKENQELREELATLKFETTFPNGLVTESCILNNINIKRETVNTDGSVYAVKADGEGVQVTINGGNYNAGSGSLYNIAIWAHHNSKIIINNGNFITGNDVNGEANHCVYAAGGSTIEINGGVFMSTGDSTWLLNCQDNNGTIVVKGGTFINFNPSEVYTEPTQPISYVAENYQVVPKVVGEDTYYTVIPSPIEE